MNTLFEHQRNTALIGSKDYNNPQAEKEAAIYALLKNLKVKTDRKNYPHSIFWFKDNQYMFEYDEQQKYFWCSYLLVWSVFEKELNMDFADTELFLRNALSQHFRRITLKANFASIKSSLQAEKHFK